MRPVHRQLVALFILSAILCTLETGCSPEWKRKFIRKRKYAVSTTQPIFLLQSDTEATYPPAVRYQEHFVHWKSWHSELLNSYGQIRKRDLRYLSGTIGELRAMTDLLSGPPAERMRMILTELNSLEEAWLKAPQMWNPSPAARTRLEQLKREIDRDLHFSKVKDSIVGTQKPKP